MLVHDLSFLRTRGTKNSTFSSIGSIVTKPAMKPCSVRIDQIDRDISSHPNSLYPDIIHFGIRPPQLSYAGSKK